MNALFKLCVVFLGDDNFCEQKFSTRKVRRIRKQQSR